MRKKVKLIIFVSLAFIILIIPVGIAVSAQISNSSQRNLGRIEPPVMHVNNGQEPVPLDSNVANDKMVFGDYEKNYCLGYSDNFKEEILTGSESTAETARITRKNTLLQDYREYVDKLYNQIMTTEEYDIHYNHLMSVFSEMLALEPEPTPQEQFEIELRCLLSKLEEDLYYSEIHGEMYIEDKKINISMLKRSIEDLTSLQKKISLKQLSFEQMQCEYATCLEEVKKASPYRFSSFVPNTGHASAPTM